MHPERQVTYVTWESGKWCKPNPNSLRIAAVLMSFLAVIFFLSALSAAQAPDQNSKPSPGMGVSTGAAHPAVKDSKSRPITAGGFVDGAPVVFEDITMKSGLEIFHHRSGTPEKRSIIET